MGRRGPFDFGGFLCIFGRACRTLRRVVLRVAFVGVVGVVHDARGAWVGLIVVLGRHFEWRERTFDGGGHFRRSHLVAVVGWRVDSEVWGGFIGRRVGCDPWADLLSFLGQGRSRIVLMELGAFG